MWYMQTCRGFFWAGGGGISPKSFNEEAKKRRSEEAKRAFPTTAATVFSRNLVGVYQGPRIGNLFPVWLEPLIPYLKSRSNSRIIERVKNISKLLKANSDVFCVCVCVLIKLHIITAQSGPVILVILCACVCVCLYVLKFTSPRNTALSSW